MKVGIYTQPLRNNYGGILQNYALQQVLIDLGHEPITLDYKPKYTFTRYLLSILKTGVLFFIPGKRRPLPRYRKAEERQIIRDFVEKNITTTDRLRKISWNIIKKNKIQVVITGSDQVWRPRYNKNLKYSYLSFANSDEVKKIAYAASFGVDYWEYSERQTKACSALAKLFKAISVREHSGIALCRDYLKVDAVEVLDPTLLISKEKYTALCSRIPVSNKPFLFVYMLDITENKKNFYERLAKERGLQVQYIDTEKNGNISVEEWLSKFRDAEYVVTDSFHGTVFSILFHKNFISVINENRGADRFVSLLSKFNLQNRLVEEKNIELYRDISVEWEEVEKKHNLEKMRSIEFLIYNMQ